MQHQQIACDRLQCLSSEGEKKYTTHMFVSFVLGSFFNFVLVEHCVYFLDYTFIVNNHIIELPKSLQNETQKDFPSFNMPLTCVHHPLSTTVPLLYIGASHWKHHSKMLSLFKSLFLMSEYVCIHVGWDSMPQSNGIGFFGQNKLIVFNLADPNELVLLQFIFDWFCSTLAIIFVTFSLLIMSLFNFAISVWSLVLVIEVPNYLVMYSFFFVTDL